MRLGIGLWLLVIGMMLPVAGMGADFRYSLSLDRHEAWVKAPIVLRFSVEQTDASKVMFFDFKPLGKGSLKAIRLDKKIDNAPHHRKVDFTYLLFGLKPGTATLMFDLLVRRTNEETIAQSTTGGRYNVKDVETQDTHEPIPPETIRLKPLPAPVELVGDFTLTGRVSAKETRAGEPIYLTVRLKGVGYPPPKRLIHLRLPGVDIFEDAPKVSLRYASNGARYDATYTYALKADHDFSIPSFVLKAFSPTSGELYRLKTKKIDIHVLPVKKTETPVRNEMIEKEKTATDGWETLKEVLFYGALFLIGYISGHLWIKISRIRNEK
ncbi:BatD family protein [Hydrogenimonas urashimensis]|uniref:BatD family protein n=1 Tax=Hydrogenimonas urashimensis TaxID=2740515 RepID=UPI00191515ED|nr:BatD family protein [Hydrogenimonas urashimensis]